MIYLALAAYNEEANIDGLFGAVLETSRQSGLPVRVVIVDDGSKDGTAAKAESWKDQLSVKVIRQPNAGFLAALERALRAALDEAKDGDVCVTMDADNTQPAPLIPQLCRKIEDGSDVVIASRFEKGGGMIGVPFHRQVMSWGAKAVMQCIVRIPGVRDYSSGYRAYRVSLLRKAFGAYPKTLLEGRGFSGMAAFLIRLSYLTDRIAEAPLLLRYDQKIGVSKMNLGQTLRGYGDLIVGRLSGAYRPKEKGR